MTTEQAEDLKDYISEKLDTYGFSVVVEEAHVRIREKLYDSEKISLTEKDSLVLFLKEVSNVLNNYSNRDYDSIIDRLNTNLAEGQVEDIVVASNDKQEPYLELKTLPDYIRIVKIIDEIILEIQNDNSTDSKNDDNTDQ